MEAKCQGVGAMMDEKEGKFMLNGNFHSLFLVCL